MANRGDQQANVADVGKRITKKPASSLSPTKSTQVSTYVTISADSCTASRCQNRCSTSGSRTPHQTSSSPP
eukprot:9117230-Heterocapsa_arctica.AAC.1